MFIEKLEERKGICSKAYLQQVLEPIIFPYWESMGEETFQWIFMKDGAKVHKGHAKLPRLQAGIRGFDWPPSSPDLNPIEKIWRWIKEELTNLSYVPTTLEDLKREVQKLWDKADLKDFRVYTERLTCKLEDVIAVKARATVH